MPTPETNAALIDGMWHNGHRLVHEEVCAKLEQERDQLREDKETMELRHAAAMIHACTIADENTQLRKVADEVLEETNSMINYCNGDIMYCVTDIRFLKARCLENLKRINSLPHVKERNTK
jgi:hypothetical protein